ncbi:MAG TPA: hypothetical protein VFY36_12455, partial [Solirubrobacteraceae bacterium]|nr:hypothetical protein [Solirubrobacteraceae bacterium]
LSPFLGPVCYLGSAAHPIVIALTTGTTSPPPPAQPISGQPAEFIHIPIIGIEQAFGLTLVSNSFSVPAASGCGTSGGNLVNASIDHKLGLPSPPGRNAIIIHANAEQGASTAVLGHGVTGE